MKSEHFTGAPSIEPRVSFDRDLILHGDYSPRPDGDALLWFHRPADQESFARSFVRNPSTGQTAFWSVAIGRLAAWTRSNRQGLWQDSYVSINSFFRKGTHRERDLRSLNAAAVVSTVMASPGRRNRPARRNRWTRSSASSHFSSTVTRLVAQLAASRCQLQHSAAMVS